MYDLPRPGKGRCRSDDGSPPKCIRPLASGLLLQPGHDEIRALRSQINGSCRCTVFCTELMYDLPRPGRGRCRSDDVSPRKCIRPLTSALLLHPGHAEIRALRSQINGSCRCTVFCTELMYDLPRPG